MGNYNSPAIHYKWRLDVIRMSTPALGKITRLPPVYKNTSLPSRVYPAPTGSSKINSRLTGGLFEWANEGPLCRGHSPHIADENIITKGSEDKTPAGLEGQRPGESREVPLLLVWSGF